MNHSPHNWKEGRRLQAWQLKQRGWSQRQIAAALGASEGAVSHWMTRARKGGPEALRHRPSPGAPRRLSCEQLARLPDLLHRGAEAYGFRGAVWTRSRVAAEDFRALSPLVYSQMNPYGTFDLAMATRLPLAA